jgi:uncharacterized protein YkwD
MNSMTEITPGISNPSSAGRRRAGRRLVCTLLAGMLTALTANAADNTQLINLINDYRESPQTCEGKKTRPVGPLAPDDALARVKIGPGTQLQSALKDAGYQAAQAQAIAVSGPSNPNAAMTAIKQRYCSILLNPQYTAIGISREAKTWHLVFARPLLSDDLGSWQEAGQEILKMTNEARTKPRSCGTQKYGTAPPLKWDEKLAVSALSHSRDMAKRNYFSHEAKDGSKVDARAKREGYNWRRIGENIATGQGSAKQVVSGWLASPGHCANIMNRNFTEMGAAYAVNPQSDTTIYWTQVFGTPR